MNAAKELLEHLGNRTLLCANITYSPDFSRDDDKKIILKVNHSFEEYTEFLKQLDIDYNNSYGTQHLYGILWYIDSTWSGRGEYDGSEWWIHHTCPEIPGDLK